MAKIWNENNRIIELSPATFRELSAAIGFTTWEDGDIDERFFPCCEDGDGTRITLHIQLDGFIATEKRS